MKKGCCRRRHLAAKAAFVAVDRNNPAIVVEVGLASEHRKSSALEIFPFWFDNGVVFAILRCVNHLFGNACPDRQACRIVGNLAMERVSI